MSEKSEFPHLAQLGDANPNSGESVTAFAWVQDVREGRTKDGRPFVDLTLADTQGALACKIWAEEPRAIEAARTLERGCAVKVLGVARDYRGAVQLNVIRIRAISVGEPGYDPDTVFGAGFAAIEDLRCQTLVFDIETVPAVDLRKVPPTIAQAVAKAAERGDGDEGKVMSLSPLFGKVVSIAVGEGEVELEEQAVRVMAVPPEGREDAEFPEWIRPMSEPEMLRAFWQLAGVADLIVTYNGSGFDIPFLVMRSLIHGIPASVDLVSKPFSLRPHLDLYKALYPRRAMGPSSLDVVCWALGITSPKGEMDGSMVAPTYAMGDIETIAEYNLGDVRATTAVYHHVRDHLLRFRKDW